MIIFFYSDKQREKALATAFVKGALAHGLDAETTSLGVGVPPSVTLACMVGVKSAKLWRFYQKRGIPTMMFDKGYSRHTKGRCWEYWRVSYNDHHPTSTTLMKRNYPGGRFNGLGFKIEPWRKQGDHILIAGSSAKYHYFSKLPDPTTYAEYLIKAIRYITDRPIIYRPKPSWKGATPIEGTSFSSCKDPLKGVLTNCHAVVTHGSNTCFEAALNGVPSIIMGEGVTKSISSTSLYDIETPAMNDREQLFYNLAYHQWTLAEFESGKAFKTIGKWL